MEQELQINPSDSNLLKNNYEPALMKTLFTAVVFPKETSTCTCMQPKSKRDVLVGV